MRTLVVLLLSTLFALPLHAQPDDTADVNYDETVKEQLDAEGWNYEIDGDGDFKMVIGFSSEDRSQLVYVISNTNSNQEFSVREVWSPVYSSQGSGIPDEVASWALERSWDMIVGSLASNGGTVYLVVKLDADASAERLSNTIRLAASVGDELEKEQSDRDDL